MSVKATERRRKLLREIHRLAGTAILGPCRRVTGRADTPVATARGQDPSTVLTCR